MKYQLCGLKFYNITTFKIAHKIAPLAVAAVAVEYKLLN